MDSKIVEISRTAALYNLAVPYLMQLDEEQIIQMLYCTYTHETGEHIVYNNIYENEVQVFLISHIVKVELKGASNDYLVSFLRDTYNREFKIIGEEDKMERCVCCGYLTLPVTGEYYICRLCNWEDDGTSELNPDKYSHPNHSTLAAFKQRFIEKCEVKQPVIIFAK